MNGLNDLFSSIFNSVLSVRVSLILFDSQRSIGICGKLQIPPGKGACPQYLVSVMGIF